MKNVQLIQIILYNLYDMFFDSPDKILIIFTITK